jgi:CheY-like chemotaxis protein
MDTSATILVADDNPDDVLLVRMAFKKAGVTSPLTTVSDGAQVVQYLKGEGIYADREKFPFPQALLLDLKMPNMGGLEVLAWLRHWPPGKNLPVIVLTHSCYDSDITQAYKLGANSFLVKPTDFHEFTAAIAQMADHWLRGTKIPEAFPFIPPPRPSPELSPPGSAPEV